MPSWAASLLVSSGQYYFMGHFRQPPFSRSSRHFCHGGSGGAWEDRQSAPADKEGREPKSLSVPLMLLTARRPTTLPPAPVTAETAQSRPAVSSLPPASPKEQVRQNIRLVMAGTRDLVLDRYPLDSQHTSRFGIHSPMYCVRGHCNALWFLRTIPATPVRTMRGTGSQAPRDGKVGRRSVTLAGTSWPRLGDPI